MIDTTQLAVLVGETFLLGGVLAFTFRMRHVVGLPVIAAVLGVLQPLQVQLTATLYAETFPGFLVSPGSTVLFVGSLFLVLLAYLREDALAVRQVIYSLVGANLMVTLLYVVFGLHLAMPTTINLLDVPPALYLSEARVMLVGTSLLVLDVLLVIGAFEALGRIVRHVSIRATLALAGVLWLDTALFMTGAFWGAPRYLTLLWSSLVAKSVAAMLYGVMFELYIRFLQPAGPPVEGNQFRDVFDALTYREKYALSRRENVRVNAAALRRRGLLLEATSDGIVVVDRTGRIVESNAAFSSSLGVPPDRLVVGQPVSDFIACPLLQAALKSGEPSSPFETTLTRLDGTPFPAELIVVDAPVDHAHILSLRDISARRDLYEERLQTSKMETVGLLAGGIAHDFNNLLTVIMSAAELAQMQNGREDDPHLDLIAHSSAQAAELTGQLLAFARKGVLRPVDLDLNQRITAQLPILQRLVGEDIELKMDLDPAARPIVASPTGLSQVILNLVANARDAMPEGGSIILRTLPDPAMPGTILEIVDAGIGMPAEVLSRIFEPYFTTKSIGRGTGLGLSTCVGIIEQIGGRITVSSAPDQGTVFRVHLPAGGEPVTPDPSQRQSRPISASAMVLLVEDNEAVRRLTERILTSHGYLVTSTDSASHALTLLSDGLEVDLLLTDVVLGQGSGDDLANQVSMLHHLPVLLMTGHALRSMNLTNNHPVLRKPFTSAELIQHVTDALAGIPVGADT